MKPTRALFLATLLCILSACSSHYPYSTNYVSTEQVKPDVIAAPPAQYSKEYWNEINEIIALQANVTPEKRKQIEDEIIVSPEMVLVKALGTDFNQVNLPKTYNLLKRVGSDNWRITDTIKEYWGTDRPWIVNERVQILVPPIYSHAYPSGHTSAAYVWAEVMAQLAPCQRGTLFARAEEVAQNRKIAGAHFGYDLASGRVVASRVVAIATQSPQYQKDFAEAQAELKAFVISRTGKGCCWKNK